MTPYRNGVLQYVLSDFLELKGYKILQTMSSAYADEEETKVAEIKCDVDETFNVYLDATILCYNPENEGRICIEITLDQHRGGVSLMIFFNDIAKNFWSEWQEYGKKKNFYKGKKINAMCDFLELNKEITWEDVIVQDKIRNKIKQNVENLFTYIDILQKNKVTVKRGVILAGPPGVGKTLICKVLIQAIKDITVLYVLPSHLKSAMDVSMVCEMARDLSPTLMVIEDIDFLAESRNTNPFGGLTVELMNQMDGVESFDGVVTLATTNMPEKIEEAIKNRPGRFDRVIQVDLPDSKDRLKMLKKFTQRFILKDVDLESIAEECNDMSGAYIYNLCETAAICAVDENSIDKDEKIIINSKHLKEAIAEIKDKDFSQWANTERSGGFGFGKKGEDVPEEPYD